MSVQTLQGNSSFKGNLVTETWILFAGGVHGVSFKELEEVEKLQFKETKKDGLDFRKIHYN